MHTKRDSSGTSESPFEDESNELSGGTYLHVSGLGPELRAEFIAFRSEMRAAESRIIRLMAVLWIGQIGVLLGIFFVFFRT